MKILRLLTLCLVILPFALNAQMKNYARYEPLLLTNLGQVSNTDGTRANHVKYYMQTPALDFFIGDNGLSYVFKDYVYNNEISLNPDPLNREIPSPDIKWHRVDLILLNSNLADAEVEMTYNSNMPVTFYNQNILKGEENTFALTSVLFKNVYPKIDWELVVDGKYLKYNFILHPGSDINDIQIEFKGQDKLSINEGKLLINTSLGTLEEGEIVSFTASGKMINVQAELNDNILSYSCENIDLSLLKEDVIIDPPLVWATYYGGSGDELAIVMERSSNGFIYTLLRTLSADFPTLDQGGISFYQGVYGTNQDMGLLKFTEDGVLTWATYIGGSAKEEPSNLFYNGIILCIVGYTESADFPTVDPGFGAFYDNSLGGTKDGFVMVFGPGDFLSWSTYLGGSADDEINDCVYGNGRLYVVGSTFSNDISLQANGGAYFDNTLGSPDAYLAEFDLTYNLDWATYIGGVGFDVVTYCDMDSLNRLVLTFTTYSNDIPQVNTMTASYASAYSSNADMAVMLFDASRNNIWSTYVGGAFNEWANDIIFDYDNRILLVGISYSGDFPVANNIGAGFYQSIKATGCDAVQMLFSDSTELLYSSFYGGNLNDVGFGVTMDSKKNIYIVGDAQSTNLLTLDPNDGSYFDATSNGSYDGYLVEYDSSFNMIWATYLGGNNYDRISDVRVSPSDHVFTVGFTQSNNHPTLDFGSGAYYDNAINGGARDAIIMKFIPCPEDFDTIYGTDSVCFNELAHIYATGGTSYLWNTTETTDTITPLITTDSMFIVEVIGPYGCIERDTFMVTVNPLPVFTFSGDTAVCFNDSATIFVDGGYNYLWEYGQTDSSITFIPAISEYIDITVTNVYGCVYSDSIYLTVYPLPIPSITGDTAICLNDTATMIVHGGSTYEWSDSSTDTLLQVSPSPAGIYNYYSIATDTNMCADTAFFSVEIYPLPVFWLGNDTTLCQGDSLLLNAENPGSDYLWSTTDTTQMLSVITQNLFYVLVTDSNTCQYSDSIDVLVIPYADATITDIIYVCENNPFFDFTAADNGGVWSGVGITDSVNGTFNPATAGVGFHPIYYVIAGFCGDADTSSIEVAEIPIFDIFVTDETCAGANDGSVLISASNGLTPYTYLLDTSLVADSNYMIPPGVYIVSVIDSRGCADTDTATVLAEDFPCGDLGYYIPNIFSPNGDGLNDVLYVRSRFIETMTLLIYDRFGEKVFESKSIDSGWDGTYNGAMVNAGVYFYVFKANMIDGTYIEDKGNVTVIR